MFKCRIQIHTSKLWVCHPTLLLDIVPPSPVINFWKFCRPMLLFQPMLLLGIREYVMFLPRVGAVSLVFCQLLARNVCFFPHLLIMFYCEICQSCVSRDSFFSLSYFYSSLTFYGLVVRMSIWAAQGVSSV